MDDHICDTYLSKTGMVTQLAAAAMWGKRLAYKETLTATIHVASIPGLSGREDDGLGALQDMPPRGFERWPLSRSPARRGATASAVSRMAATQARRQSPALGTGPAHRDEAVKFT